VPTPDLEPEASIVIPAYNAEAHLVSAVKSALSQTLQRIEVIIIDDASEDGTLNIAQALASEDARVKVIANPVRLGPAGGRNAGLDQARGRWIALLDADDHYQPERLEAMISEAERRGCDFLADDLLLCDVKGGQETRAFDPDVMERQEPLSLLDLVTMDAFPKNFTRSIGFCKPIFRRDFIRDKGLKYDLRAFVGQDFVFYFKAIAADARFCLMPQAFYRFTVGHASHSTGLGALTRVAETHARLLEEEAWRKGAVLKALRQRQASIHFEIFRVHLRRHAPLEAIKTLTKVQASFFLVRFTASLRRRLGSALGFGSHGQTRAGARENGANRGLSPPQAGSAPTPAMNGAGGSEALRPDGRTRPQ